MWSEVNSRVNYPIKAILVEMMEGGLLNIDDPLHLFCASWLSIQVSSVGIQSFLDSWNHHTIPGIIKLVPHIVAITIYRCLM